MEICDPLGEPETLAGGFDGGVQHPGQRHAAEVVEEAAPSITPCPASRNKTVSAHVRPLTLDEADPKGGGLRLISPSHRPGFSEHLIAGGAEQDQDAGTEGQDQRSQDR